MIKDKAKDADLTCGNLVKMYDFLFKFCMLIKGKH